MARLPDLRFDVIPSSYNHTPGFCARALAPRGRKPAGEICAYRQFWLQDGHPIPWGVEFAHVKPTYRRRRLATRLYEMAAVEACQRGAPLMSDIDRSESADAFWRKQQRKKRATRHTIIAEDGDALDYYILRCPPPKSLARSLGMAREAKIVGNFCREVKASRSHFDPRSFRYIQRGKSWILIGCPKGSWQPRKQRCKVGTRAYEVLKSVPKRGRCPRGSIRIRK